MDDFWKQTAEEDVKEEFMMDFVVRNQFHFRSQEGLSSVLSWGNKEVSRPPQVWTLEWWGNIPIVGLWGSFSDPMKA